MPTRAKHHHYIPQCYLRGFTRNKSKNSKITVIDFAQKKLFETVPRNVGGVRDFNRIEIDGQPPDALEAAFSKFEGDLARCLKNFESSLLFEGEARNYILNLIALLAIRSPFRRENWREFIASVSEHIMDIELSSKERWESLIRRMREDGKKVNEKITYEQVKEFHDRKEYDIEVSTERHIEMEVKGIDKILPLLSARKWLIIKASDLTGPFITSDNPVALFWKNPERVPNQMMRQNPGYGLRDTKILFPLSQNLLLLGDFDGRDGVTECSREEVASINSELISNAVNQIYASRKKFNFINMEGKIIAGENLV